jgi:hypothetical protein
LTLCSGILLFCLILKYVHTAMYGIVLYVGKAKILSIIDSVGIRGYGVQYDSRHGLINFL